MNEVSPDGGAMTGDGLPSLPGGEPILPRWFAAAMVVLVPLGIAAIIVVFLVTRSDPIAPELRRPPGSDAVTHDRGDAVLNRIDLEEDGPECVGGVTVVGDESALAAGRAALAATCQLLQSGAFHSADEGAEAWAASGGILRFGVFELTGVDSSARREGGRLVIELNAKFQFDRGDRASPTIIHELVHLGSGFPGRAVTAEDELAAVHAQGAACERLAFRDEPPRTCLDADELLALDDPLAALVEAGFPHA